MEKKTTVYLDPRSPLKEEEERQEEEQAVEQVSEFIASFCLLLVKSLVLMLLWNWTLTSVLEVKQVNYFQSFSICVISNILLRGKND